MISGRPIRALGEATREVQAINRNVRELTVVQSVISNIQDSLTFDTLYLAYARFIRAPRRQERQQVEDWLKARTKTDKVRLVYN